MTDNCFFYLRLPDRTPVGVVALEVLADGDPEDPQVRVAASLCHEADEWVRKAGVNKARGRLKSEAYSYAAYRDDPLGFVLGELGIDHVRRGVDMVHAEALFSKQIDYLLTEPEDDEDEGDQFPPEGEPE